MNHNNTENNNRDNDTEYIKNNEYNQLNYKLYNILNNDNIVYLIIFKILSDFKYKTCSISFIFNNKLHYHIRYLYFDDIKKVSIIIAII